MFVRARRFHFSPLKKPGKKESPQPRSHLTRTSHAA